MDHFTKLYAFTNERLSHMAKRKWRWLAQPIIDEMNGIMDDILSIHNPFLNRATHTDDTSERIQSTIKRLTDLQKPLVALWNVEHYSMKRMARWANMINEEIYYLGLIGDLGLEEGERYMFILDYEAIDKMDCLRTLCEFHRFIYSKTISLPTQIRDSRGSMLMDLVDAALYHAAEANRSIPATKQQYMDRAAHIAIAIDSLHHMQTPMVAVFNVMGYSEAVMLQWCDYLVREIDMLVGLQKSDKKRFEKLI